MQITYTSYNIGWEQIYYIYQIEFHVYGPHKNKKIQVYTIEI